MDQPNLPLHTRGHRAAPQAKATRPRCGLVYNRLMSVIRHRAGAERAGERAGRRLLTRLVGTARDGPGRTSSSAIRRERPAMSLVLAASAGGGGWPES